MNAKQKTKTRERRHGKSQSSVNAPGQAIQRSAAQSAPGADPSAAPSQQSGEKAVIASEHVSVKSHLSNASSISELAPGQSLALLKALHIATREGRINQDSRRKLKQVNHLYQFIEPALKSLTQANPTWTLVDHGAGKSYLGFILMDLYLRKQAPEAHVIGIERRHDLVEASRALAREAGFEQMTFLALTAQESIESDQVPTQVEMVTALHACDTATDDAIRFGLSRKAQFMVLVPCCQAEVASLLRQSKRPYDSDPFSELWRRPLHTREFGSHLTNTLRCLQLEAHGYQVKVTELVGWEHAMKNELIIAQRKGAPQRQAACRLNAIVERIGLPALRERFFVPSFDPPLDALTHDQIEPVPASETDAPPELNTGSSRRF